MYVRHRELLAELQQLERKERDATRSKRLRVIILAMRGWTAPAIAASVGLSRRDCQQWVYRFNELGIPGLEDLHGGGRTAPLTDEQEDRLRERLAAGPTEEDRVCSLRGADIQTIVEKEFGVLRSLSGIYRLLHRLGYSYLRPRPRHYKADPQAKTAFQEQLPKRSCSPELNPIENLRHYLKSHY